MDKFVTNVLMMKLASGGVKESHLPKVKTSDMLFSTVSLCCERSETGRVPDPTVLSLTSAVISHGC